MDRKQAAAFLRDCMKPVYGYCLRRCASPQDAEDTAQEILLRMYAMLQQRSDVADPDRYLWTVARNTLANHYRSRARLSIGVPVDVADKTDLQSALLAQEETRRQHDELSHLSHQQREIVVMRYGLDGKPERTQKEVADSLGISQSYISRLEKRVINKLRDAMRSCIQEV